MIASNIHTLTTQAIAPQQINNIKQRSRLISLQSNIFYVLTSCILFGCSSVMEFEWDNLKNNTNIAKHGINFEFAKEVFFGIWISKPDNRKDYGEHRFIALGCLEEFVLLVICEDRKYVLSR